MEVGAYFYPLTTNCPEKTRRSLAIGQQIGLEEGQGVAVIDETLLAQRAIPLFEGHQQPSTYCLDARTTCWDDSNDAAMDAQIDLAKDAGLGFFIFDSYEGRKLGRPVVESDKPIAHFRSLSKDRGIKYAKMETFASPRALLPISKDPDFYEPHRVYDTSRESVRFIVDHCMQNDWTHPNYLHINGRPYISLFVPDLTPGWNNGQERCNELVGEFHGYASKQYGVDPYVVGVIRNVSQAHEMVRAGADALTGYALLPDFGDHVPPIQDYAEQLDKKMIEWEKIQSLGTFIPPAVVGWDASPRGKSAHQLGMTEGYGYAPIVTGGSPHLFEGMLRRTIECTAEVPIAERYALVCAWNEITEGAALLPRMDEAGNVDTSYLDTVRKVAKDL